MTGPVLSVEDVTVRFSGLVALDEVSVDVQPAHLHGIIGPNGAGKTTLFDAITGVYRARTGKVLLGGRDVTKWSPHRRAHAGLARSFQTVGLAGGLTAEQNVLVTIEALDRVRSPYPLPGGTKRRRQQAKDTMNTFG